ncbi:PHP domain-containing protein [Clostridium sp. Cult3]|uniref:PHP domain-containing protein n=1 Tax=Clostridium sp. Cult3 TaxID=2079004 RepID=UPI001F3AAA57|nr:PHP domain-containing protein [Clostridium sp. Cult3]MCF6459757.1 phosphatase [Clostridium sp. Cult3]
MIFDLHVHTNYSDGLLTPKQVIDLAVLKGLDGIAITDHDTVDGIKSAIQYSKTIDKIYIIPGIEFGCIYKDEEVHILGYFIDYKSSIIEQVTDSLRQERILRGLKIIDKVNSLGMKIDVDEVYKIAEEDYIGRPHIARVLVKHGYVSNVKEAFELYLNRGKPAYIERKTLSIVETIDLIHKLEGIAILAHPGVLKDNSIIDYCIHMGIDGIEAIHSKHDSDSVKYLLEVAKQYGLIVTGGSDCHGEIIDGDYLLGKYYININHIPIMKGRI